MEDWLLGVGRRVAALYQAIWLYRNDIIFDKHKHTTLMQVIFSGIYWLRHWALPHKEEEREPTYMACGSYEGGCYWIFRQACRGGPKLEQGVQVIPCRGRPKFLKDVIVTFNSSNILL